MLQLLTTLAGLASLFQLLDAVSAGVDNVLLSIGSSALSATYDSPFVLTPACHKNALIKTPSMDATGHSL